MWGRDGLTGVGGVEGTWEQQHHCALPRAPVASVLSVLTQIRELKLRPTCFCLRTFAPDVFSSWNALPNSRFMAAFFLFFDAG